MDLKSLPSDAFTRKSGTLGFYYVVSIELAMKFGNMLEFEMMWDGRVVGTVTANYA